MLERDELHRGVQRRWPRWGGGQRAGNLQNSGFTGAHVVESQGSLTFVLLHRTAPRKCVGNTRLMCLVELWRAVMNTHICAVYYWQASQRNFHFIWNPGVVCGTGRGLISAKFQGMWSAQGACSQPNRLFANGCVVSLDGTCQVLW